MLLSRSLCRLGHGVLGRRMVSSVENTSAVSVPKPKKKATRNPFEPEYLEAARSEIPEYQPINIQIKGFDFVVLQKFQSRIHKIAYMMGLRVTDSWAQECQLLNVVTFKPNSELVDNEYAMKKYERNVQVSDALAYEIPVLIDIILSACPPGVSISVHNHEEHHFENRFVPEMRVLELQDQLDELAEKEKEIK
ncbi:UNVERIFIED_CONTAM: hypothetical protein PYX00_009773 [Menopon gallinae]|uniref:Small ribosomal subunit protein uS10 domain-containing protein n=1 Tax=Menopon gallinae TaxID=328185 RepID=A0AAW2HCH7_9NEOP